METITKRMSFLLFTIFIFSLHLANAEEELIDKVLNAAGEQLVGTPLVEKVCEDTPEKEACVDALSSDPASIRAITRTDLALLSLKLAANNAKELMTDAKMMIDNPDLDPAIQQGLADCKETVLDAEGQLEDTAASLLNGQKKDAQLWLRAALAAVKTCDDSIPGDDDVLSKKSLVLRKLCTIAMAISKSLGEEDD